MPRTTLRTLPPRAVARGGREEPRMRESPWTDSRAQAPLFDDREHAGRELARRLVGRGLERPLVLGLPRGGVPVAYAIAAALRAPMDVLVVRKLGVPSQPELAFGAIAPGVRVLHRELVDALGLSDATIEAVTARESAELERRRARYRASRPPLDVRGRTVVLVDDGIATGATARAALRWLKPRHPRRIVLAVAVIAADTAEALRDEVDELVALAIPTRFDAVGTWYRRFDAVPDEVVVDLMDRARAFGSPEPEGPVAPAHEVAIPVGAVTLEGSLTVPAHARGLVLFAHGSGSGRRSPRNLEVARRLHDAGLATLLFDLLTGDEAAVDEVDARHRFDVARLASRLLGATTWARRHRATHALPFGYFGASTGAAAALVAAAARPDDVGAVVSRGGRPDLAGDAALGAVRAPTLLIVGGADEEVLELNRRALARMHAPARLEVVRGATHLFEEHGALDEVARLAASWFLRHLAATRAEA